MVGPEGFRYQPGVLGEDRQAAILAELGRLAYEGLSMRGVAAKRTVADFGVSYSFETFRTSPAPALPEFLQQLRQAAARFAGVPADAFEEALVNRYPAGAGIGWHRDAAPFGDTVAGVSLGSPCELRLRPGTSGRAAFVQVLEPGSLYVLSGPARWSWQHAILRTPGPRFSITFRTLRRARPALSAELRL